MRPSPALARYATPVQGLYLCGAGTHPGGGVIAAAGHNAAHRALRDLNGHSVHRHLTRWRNRGRSSLTPASPVG
jgi:phytoene dehydrogenase-like protein